MGIPWNVKRILLQELLKQIRLDAQITQADLAKRLGKPQSYISKYESGERRLDIIELQDVCEAVGSSLGDFVRNLEAAFSSEENFQQ